MSIYVLNSEPELTAPADADYIPIFDASSGSIKRITLANLRQTVVGGTPVTITAASDAITRAEHAGRLVLLDRAGGIDLTLPEATGSGDKYEFVILTATTDAYTWTCEGDGVIAGHALADDGDGEPANGWTDANATVITLGGTAQATGGSIGDRVILTDIGADLWQASLFLTQGGTEATPFS
jgi:hypothetical protein